MDYKAAYSRWAASKTINKEERAELEALAGDEEALADRFGRGLEFGTAGLRGMVGMGTNRMNTYVVRQAAYGFGRVLLEEKPSSATVCLCFDCRHNSLAFAREAAAVLAGMGVSVRMFVKARPTPQLSFAVRRLGADGGINITASHNPAGYNGFKAFWRDGAQISGEAAGRIAAHMAAVSALECAPKISFARAVRQGLISFLDKETDEEYILACLSCAVDPDAARLAAGLKIIYTPFHGVGGAIMPQVLERAGFDDVFFVPEQFKPDGDFPTLASPNPEDPKGFELAIKYAGERDADLIIGTDPDADRVAAVVPGRDGVWTPITGSQMGALLTDYIIQSLARQGRLPQKPAIVQTIVSGRLSIAVARAAGVQVRETFTGFRFMAAEAARLETAGGTCLLAWEESIGYMTGSHVRDKDGITAGMLIAQMAAWHKARGKSLLDALEELWQSHGYFAEGAVYLSFPGPGGLREIQRVMACMRNMPPKEISGVRVAKARDYLAGYDVNMSTREKTPLALKGMNVLSYLMQDGAEFFVRPSGTEPKIKVYIHVRGDTRDSAANAVKKYAAETADTLRLRGGKAEVRL